MYEFTIQKKELGHFDIYSLKDVEASFEKIQLVSFNENKRLKIGNTELIVSAVPSGNSIGGTAWKIEFQKQTIMYGVELYDRQQQITPGIKVDNFKNVNIFITNAFPQWFSPLDERLLGFATSLPSSKGQHNLQVSVERLQFFVERAILETSSQVLIPCSSKNKILSVLLLLENLF